MQSALNCCTRPDEPVIFDGRAIVRSRAAEAEAYLARNPNHLVWGYVLVISLVMAAAIWADGAVLFQAFRSFFEDSRGQVRWGLALGITSMSALSVIQVKNVLGRLPYEVEIVLAMAVSSAVLVSLFFLGSAAFEHAAAESADMVFSQPFDAAHAFDDGGKQQEHMPPTFIYGVLVLALVFLCAAMFSCLKRSWYVLIACRRAKIFLEEYDKLLASEREVAQLRTLGGAIDDSERIAIGLIAAKLLDGYTKSISAIKAEAQNMLDRAESGSIWAAFGRRLRHRVPRTGYFANPAAIIAKAEECLKVALQLRIRLIRGESL